MLKMNKKIWIGMALSVMLFVSACTAAEPAEPTADLNAIKTEAVKTAMAEMTVQAALSPTETDVPATLTPLPTATLDSDAAQPAASSSSSSSGSSSGGGGGTSGTPIPTWTPDVYRCEFVTQTPLDGPQTTGWNYDFVMTMRNVGIADWTKADYYVKWVGGDDLSPSHIYKLPHDVGYWETVDITIDIQVPTQPKSVPGYITEWAIVNDNGEEFCNFYHQITMTLTPVPTNTKTP
jgi:hypothetical protein